MLVRRLAWAALAATLLLIAAGGLVRATDSGLACPDWPACYGRWIPPAELQIWFEHGHRLWAGVTVSLIAALAVSTRRLAPRLFPLSLAALGLALVQAALGAAVVLQLLRAELVTAHLGTSLLIVGALVVVAVRATLGSQARPPGVPLARFGRWAAVIAAVVFVQALLGAQGTGYGIAHTFDAFPIWLADEAWRGDVRQLLHVAHRAGGYLVAAGVVGLAVVARRRTKSGDGIPGVVLALVTLAGVLVALQVALGIANVTTRGAAWSATAHLTIASWIWTTLVATTAMTRRQAPLPVARGERQRLPTGPV